MIKSPALSLLILAGIIAGIAFVPSAFALPVSYNQTSLNFGLTSVPRNSSSYDIFPLIPDNWLWLKFDNDTIDSSLVVNTGTITYNTNLKAFWKLENVTTDSTGNGHTLTKAAGTNRFVSGAEGKGAQFDGSTYYTATSTTVITGANDRSVSFWIFTPSSFSANNQYIFAWGSTNANQLFGAVFSDTGATSHINFVSFGANDRISSTALSASTWYYLTFTLSSGGTVKNLYINGVLDANFPYTVTAQNTSSSTFYLGSAIGGGAALMSNNAIIDEFRIYSISLSSDQAKADYMVGHYSQSHTFDNGEYVSLGDVLKFKNTDAFSLTTWIKTTLGSGESGIIAKGGGGFTGYDLHMNTGQAVFRLWDTGNHEIFSGSTISDGNWHYIAGTYDGSGNSNGMKLYVDGVLKSTGSAGTVGSLTTSSALTIGTYTPSGSSFLVGQLDNSKIYPYALSQAQITADYNSISPISSGKQFMSYYHGISGSSTLTNKLGFGATTTLLCSLSNSPQPVDIVSNNSQIYYGCSAGPLTVKKFDVVQNTNTHVYSSTVPSGWSSSALFMGLKHIFSGVVSGTGFNSQLNSEKGNVTQGGSSGTWTATNQQINVVGIGTSLLKFNDNSTSVRSGASSNQCNINFKSTNTTKALDSIACDQAVPAMAIKYWNGMAITGIGNYLTNQTQPFLNSIDASAYKKLLTLPCIAYGAESPCITFILTDSTQTDWLVVLTSAHVYYGKAQTALTYLTTNNYALQSYDVVTVATDSTYPIPNPILQDMTLYGFNLNVTVHKTGMLTLASGYSLRTTTQSPSIRLIDPRWSNDATDMPIISTTGSLFPIALTITNAPSFSAVKVTQGSQIINSQESVYAVAQLDSTRSVEFDLPSGTCANVYVADISVSPSIWNFEGIICATGTNSKTVSYTNTLPIAFWTSKYSATHSYTPSTNIVGVTTRATVGPYTQNIVIKNANGTAVQNFTSSVNSTMDTENFNITGVSKPVTLYVSINGNPIYSAFLGSPVSFASASSFFSTYFSYHGFNLLSLIPIIFAGMFTRNSVGIGAVAVVLLIASLNFFSLVVVPEAVITVMMFVSLIGLVAYRVILY